MTISEVDENGVLLFVINSNCSKVHSLEKDNTMFTTKTFPYLAFAYFNVNLKSYWKSHKEDCYSYCFLMKASIIKFSDNFIIKKVDIFLAERFIFF
jgi:hypothetical protein